MTNVGEKLVIGISSRALFDLEVENQIFEEQGLEAYSNYQLNHAKDIMRPGAAFPLVKALLSLNTKDKLVTEVDIMSRNSADSCMRLFNSLEEYGLDIERFALLGGAPIAPYLAPFHTDLFLSANREDVESAIEMNIAAGLIYTGSKIQPDRSDEPEQIRIAFDGDSVLFSGESDYIFNEKGLEAFEKHEIENAEKPMVAGPFGSFLKKFAAIQNSYPREHNPIRTALVTSRTAPAHKRVVNTLLHWNIKIDEMFFLGDMGKQEVLAAFRPHIFFDDRSENIASASKFVPSAMVPAKTNVD